MNPRVERSINRIATQARSRYAAMLGSARTQTTQVAGRIQKGKKPVKTLSRLGVKLTDVSHRATANVVRQQSTLVENQLDALASSLRDAAKAKSFRDLVRTQARRIPANTALLLNDSRETLSIVAAAGGEVRGLLASTVAEFRGKRPKARKSAKKTAAKTPAKSQPKAKATTAAAKKAPTRAKAQPKAA